VLWHGNVENHENHLHLVLGDALGQTAPTIVPCHRRFSLQLAWLCLMTVYAFTIVGLATVDFGHILNDEGHFADSRRGMLFALT
jgi:hypothetical protein